MFDLLFQQGDRHAENIFVEPSTGRLKMIDTRDGVMAGGIDSIYLPGTFLFQRNTVGNGALLSPATHRAVSHEMPLLSLDWRCHARHNRGVDTSGGEGGDAGAGARARADAGDTSGDDGDVDGEREVMESEDGITWTPRRDDDAAHPLVGVKVGGKTSGSGGMELPPQLKQCLRRFRQLGPG